jgi:hypothetical protein
MINYVGISAELSFALWNALQQTDAGRSVLLTYHLTVQHKGNFRRWLDTALAPTQLLPLIETLVEQQLLSRDTANLIADKVLDRTSKTGRWLEEAS